MHYRGQVKNGVVVLQAGTRLPDGTEVQVLPVAEDDNLPTLAERFADVTGKAVGLPEDLAENHDHYLHGQPKRSGQ